MSLQEALVLHLCPTTGKSLKAPKSSRYKQSFFQLFVGTKTAFINIMLIQINGLAKSGTISLNLKNVFYFLLTFLYFLN